MLLTVLADKMAVRSTAKITSKKMAPIILCLSSAACLFIFDIERKPEDRELKFTAVQMITICMFIEIKKLTLEGYTEMVTGRGSQIILKNLGMPEVNGKYLAPSIGWISQFRNHEYPKIRLELEAEFREAVIAMTADDRTITIDSTPAEASRYSKWADFNAHYRIRMAKIHIMMINGIPIYGLVTNGNAGDNPEFLRMLSGMSNGRMGDNTVVLSDGGYDSHETYADVFLKTGRVMGSNTGKDSVFHKEAGWRNVVKRYNALHAVKGFIPSSRATPEFILRFLARNGEKEIVGFFLRNLDMRRGDRIHRHNAKKRHICETVHHGMKRWVDLDVRGLDSRYVGRRIMFRLMVCSLLSVFFRPYFG